MPKEGRQVRRRPECTPDSIEAGTLNPLPGAPIGMMPGPHAAIPRSKAITASPNIRPLRILVADDYAMNQVLVRRLLEAQGHEVLVATNGRETLSLWEQHPVDVILMDVQMPDLSGLEVTTAIRQAEASGSRHTLILALTADEFGTMREPCLQAGMDGFLSKPVRYADLAEALGTAQARNNHDGQALSPPARSRFSLFDPEGALQRTYGDKDVLLQLIQLFREQNALALAAATQSVATTDHRELAFQVHRLRGSLGILAVRSLHALAGRLEGVANAADWSQIPGMWEEMRESLHRLEAELLQFLQDPEVQRAPPP